MRDKAFLPLDQSCRKCGPMIKQAHFSSGMTIGGGVYHYLPNCS